MLFMILDYLLAPTITTATEGSRVVHVPSTAVVRALLRTCRRIHDTVLDYTFVHRDFIGARALAATLTEPTSLLRAPRTTLPHLHRLAIHILPDTPTDTDPDQQWLVQLLREWDPFPVPLRITTLRLDDELGRVLAPDTVAHALQLASRSVQHLHLAVPCTLYGAWPTLTQLHVGAEVMVPRQMVVPRLTYLSVARGAKIAARVFRALLQLTTLKTVHVAADVPVPDWIATRGLVFGAGIRRVELPSAWTTAGTVTWPDALDTVKIVGSDPFIAEHAPAPVPPPPRTNHGALLHAPAPLPAWALPALVPASVRCLTVHEHALPTLNAFTSLVRLLSAFPALTTLHLAEIKWAPNTLLDRPALLRSSHGTLPHVAYADVSCTMSLNALLTATLPSLMHLTIRDSAIVRGHLSHLPTRAPQIACLTLVNGTVEAGALAAVGLGQCPALQHVILHQMQIFDDVVDPSTAYGGSSRRRRMDVRRVVLLDVDDASQAVLLRRFNWKKERGKLGRGLSSKRDEIARAKKV
ncbi:hypothetical protein AMAG_00384 [Allomyces macrogynus ATCC 38327]|uniref:F-box domain-containing protein n=1 Tax=Allomyces macrogynus (strain ATCC 38327) TaxID=578462 RepID=A0A0L0RWD1_ALLM3|nr:hypothetical protein AMAG_00384 [Allomyces macrogynus ATCC 38327]|eukprot:KNE54410.1 hypothetical protein AMAG_00384 [Allomyces macrogynus ATCC 38327]